MAATAIATWQVSPSVATNEAARTVARGMSESQAQLQHSYALGQIGKGALAALVEVFELCRHENWDSYGACAIGVRAFYVARELLFALPLGAPAPLISAEPDGHLTFEWHRTSLRTLSVSISDKGELHYAAILGSRTAYGTEPFQGSLPQVLAELIREVGV